MLFKRKRKIPSTTTESNSNVEEVFIDPVATVPEEPITIPNGTITTSYLGKPLSEIPYRTPFKPES